MKVHRVKPATYLTLAILAFVGFLPGCGGLTSSSMLPAAAIAPAVGAAAPLADQDLVPAGADEDTNPDVGKPTTAWGIVTGYSTITPLSGVLVRLFPWRPCRVVQRDKLDCPQPIAKTLTGKEGHFTLHAPGGHYLLVIGTNNPDDYQATVHDSVELHGGTQRLYGVKPCVEAYSWGQGSPDCIYKPPLVSLPEPERNGNYRLLKLAAAEIPCLKDINAVRIARGYAPMELDEWLAENVREEASYRTNPQRGKYPIKGYGMLTVANSQGYGGSSCMDVIKGALQPPQSLRKYIFNPQTRWFGGRYDPYVKGTKQSAYGAAEFRPDPRALHDRAVPYWP